MAYEGEEYLREYAHGTTGTKEIIAAAVVAASLVLGLEMFDVQLQGALALTEGKIAEMRTGEGKTLAAAPAVVLDAQQGEGGHLMTVKDYLARRGGQWIGEIFQIFWFFSGLIPHEMSTEE